MKRCIAAFILALVGFPTAAFAMPDDVRAQDQRVPSSSLGVPPNLKAPGLASEYAVPRHLDATGTDVAAPDQQASTGAVAPAPAPASVTDGFDWADAGIGAAGAASLLGVSLAGGLVLRRRRVSALA